MTPMLEKTLRKTGPYIFEELVDPSSTFNQQRIYPGVRAGLIRKLTGVLSPFGLALPEVSRRERRAKNEGNGETETSA
jgi:hypothetical protein